jgi:hypothetical protein
MRWLHSFLAGARAGAPDRGLAPQGVALLSAAALAMAPSATALVCGCGSREPQGAVQNGARTATQATSPHPSQVMPAFFPADALRLDGPGDVVLVEGKHGIRLTVGEYNARTEDERIMSGLDTLAARQSLLDRLIDFKVAAVEARLRGYTATAAANTFEEERELAQQILQRSIQDATSIGDEEARAFAQSHADRLPQATPEQLSDPGFLMHVKYIMQDQRLRERLTTWQAREEVTVRRDRFEALGRGAPPSAHAAAAADPKPESTKEPRP